MASTPAPPIIKRIGAMYSWLIRQPAAFAVGVRSVDDAERLYDAYAKAGIQNVFDDYNPLFAIAAIGYDPAASVSSVANVT